MIGSNYNELINFKTVNGDGKKYFWDSALD